MAQGLIIMSYGRRKPDQIAGYQVRLVGCNDRYRRDYTPQIDVPFVVRRPNFDELLRIEFHTHTADSGWNSWTDRTSVLSHSILYGFCSSHERIFYAIMYQCVWLCACCNHVSTGTYVRMLHSCTGTFACILQSWVYQCIFMCACCNHVSTGTYVCMLQ